jgi:hypothetical protein
MADLRISQLPVLTGALLQANDPLAVADLSASETKQITAKEFVQGAVALIDAGSIPGDKVNVTLTAGSVGTTELADDAVTASKLADSSSAVIGAGLPVAGAYIGQIAVDSGTNQASIWDGTVWQPFQTGIVSITGGTVGAVTTNVTLVGTSASVLAQVDDATGAGQFLAGPATSAGAFSRRTIVASDLPLATNATPGVAAVPVGEGLRIDGGVSGLEANLEVDNDVTASSTNHVVTYDAKGLVTGGRSILGTDLPTASTGSSGVIKAGTQFSVDGTGTLLHANSTAPGTYTKVTVNAQGHVESGTTLGDSDIPNITAAKLTSGTLDVARIGNNTLDGVKLSDSSTVKFGGAGSTANIVTFPAADFKGQYFWDEIHDDLYLWSGSAWLPVTITSGELIFAGTYDASTNLVDSVTSAGSALGLTIGGALPAAAESNNRYYLVVSTSGIGTGNAPPEPLAPPDMILSNGATWELIDVSNAIAGQTATNISFTPFGNISSTNVQLAIQELDTIKIGAANPIFTGDVTISTGGTLVLEGATDNEFETTLTVVDPTADRTVTFQDASGTVALTSDLDDGTY